MRLLSFLFLIAGFSFAQANQCRIYGANRILHRLKNSEMVVNTDSMASCYNLAIKKAMGKREAVGYKGELEEVQWFWTYNDGWFNDSDGAVNYRTPWFYKYPGVGDRFISNERLKEIQERAKNQFE